MAESRQTASSLRQTAIGGTTGERQRIAFAATLAVLLLVKLYVAYTLPVNSDEAYFYLWGKYLDYGYYDHPPMIGWWLAALGSVSESPLMLRMPAILVLIGDGVFVYCAVRERDERVARLSALIFLLTPIYALDVLITTDIPLLAFAWLSAWVFGHALQTGRMRWYAVAGALLGCAFLAKYFAVLLGLAYLAYFVLARPPRWQLALALVVACALPAGLLNLAWNYVNCWDNILFNSVNRTRDEQWEVGKLLEFLGTQLYLVGPVLLFEIWRARGRVGAAARRAPVSLYAICFALPLTIYLLVSPLKTVGLHWVLIFYPFLFIVLGHSLDVQALRRGVVFAAFFTMLHLLGIVALLHGPAAWWQGTSYYPSMVYYMNTARIAREIEARAPDAELATTSYARSATLEYHGGRRVIVFGGGSQHGRQDDILTDFRTLAGRDIFVLTKSRPDPVQYLPYFADIELVELRVAAATIHGVLGRGFEYTPYRDQVLGGIRDSYYRIPSSLPVGECEFCNRYFDVPGCVDGAASTGAN
ncbi:MAG: glycosyltransferase family 39 protein [Gammaproteobacteria bacterium]|nr:glycosyltransferase family 39 protein [Gammaproteobacteria bacterium]